jgi:hypothetical protein
MYVCLFFTVTVFLLLYLVIHVNHLSFKGTVYTCKLLKQHFTSVHSYLQVHFLKPHKDYKYMTSPRFRNILFKYLLPIRNMIVIVNAVNAQKFLFLQNFK